MSDKERLEEAERNFYWLKEQAERVPHHQSIIGDLQKDLIRYLEQNERYREALKFYADEENYVKVKFEALSPSAKSIMMSMVEWDDGDKARQLLEGVTNG